MKSATCAHLTIIKNVLRAKTLLLLLLLLQRNTTLQNPPFCMQKKTFSFFPPSPKMDFASTPSLIDFQTTFIIIAFFSYLHNWLTWQHNTTKVVSTNPKRVFHKIFWNYNCAIEIGDVSSPFCFESLLLLYPHIYLDPSIAFIFSSLYCYKHLT